MAIPLPTQIELNNQYQELAQYEANQLGITIDISNLTDFNIKGQVLSGVIAGMAQDATTMFNNTYPQYADSQGINLILSNAGVPVIFPSSPSIVQLEVQDLVFGKVYNLPVGSILTGTNGSTYTVIGNNTTTLISITITSVNNTFSAVSILKGQNTAPLIGEILTLTPAIVSTDGSTSFSDCTVSSSTDGANEETLTSATSRAIEIEQTPLCGTRSSDFKNIILQAVSIASTTSTPTSITNAIVLINNQLTYSTASNNIGVFILSGTPINDTILNHGLLDSDPMVFSRTDSTDIVFAQNILNQQDIIGVPTPIASTVGTQQLTSLTGSPNPFFKIVVTLQTGYNLSTLISLIDNDFTISQLIQREVRRAICNQPLGATLSYNGSGIIISSTFPVSSIEQQLDSALGTSNTAGTLGSFLLNRTVYVWNGSSYVYQVTIPLITGLPVANSDYLYWIYDVSTTAANIYPNILVSL